MKRRILSLTAALVLTGLLFTACGSQKGAGGAAQNSTQAKMDSAAQPAPAQQVAGNASREAQAKPGTPVGAPNQPMADRKIILNAEIDLKIKNADDAVSTIHNAVKAAGGYVQETRQEGTKQQGRRTHVVVRVPSGRYESMLDLVAGLGEVNNRREWTNDVTEEYLDLDARIRSKEAHLAQLQKLYAKGGSIKELMELESEIARVTGELESIKGRFNFLSNQVAFSTITIVLYEPGVPTPIQPPKTVVERMKHGFISSWNGVVNFTGNLVVFLVSMLPVFAYLAVLGGTGYSVWRLVRRRFPAIRPKPPSSQSAPPAPPEEPKG